MSAPARGEEFKDDFRKALPAELMQRLTRRGLLEGTGRIAFRQTPAKIFSEPQTTRAG